MPRVKIEHGFHTWEKVNLVTEIDARGTYDEYKCKCGIKGKSRTIGYIDIPETYKIERVERCANYQAPKKVQVIHCTASGKAFKNLTPDSIHEVIPTPHGEKDGKGVWVMGVGEPVLLLYSEYREL